MLTNQEKIEHLERMYRAGTVSSHDYEMGMLDLQYDSPELKQTDEYKLKKLKLQNSYEEISDYDYAIQSYMIVNKDKTINEKKIGQLDIQLRYGQIEQSDYEIQKAQLENRPLALVRLIYDKETNPDEGYFDVKFNKLFVSLLKSRGYAGSNDDEIVDQWVDLQYKSVAASLSDEEMSIESYNDVISEEDIILDEGGSDDGSIA